jgi:hypothetical protein
VLEDRFNHRLLAHEYRMHTRYGEDQRGKCAGGQEQ